MVIDGEARGGRVSAAGLLVAMALVSVAGACSAAPPPEAAKKPVAADGVARYLPLEDDTVFAGRPRQGRADRVVGLLDGAGPMRIEHQHDKIRELGELREHFLVVVAAVALGDAVEHARRVGRGMDHDTNRCRQVRGQRASDRLQGFDSAKVGRDSEVADVAEKMIRKLRAGMMPPQGSRRPEPALITAFVTSMETRLDQAAARPVGRAGADPARAADRKRGERAKSDPHRHADHHLEHGSFPRGIAPRLDTHATITGEV